MLNEKTSFEVQTFLLLTNQVVTLAPTTFLHFFPCMEETQKSSRSSRLEQMLKKTYRPWTKRVHEQKQSSSTIF